MRNDAPTPYPGERRVFSAFQITKRETLERVYSDGGPRSNLPVRYECTTKLGRGLVGENDIVSALEITLRLIPDEALDQLICSALREKADRNLAPIVRLAPPPPPMRDPPSATGEPQPRRAPADPRSTSRAAG